MSYKKRELENAKDLKKSDCESLEEEWKRDERNESSKKWKKNIKYRKRLAAVTYKPIYEKECRIDLLDKPLKLDNWIS